MIKQTRQIKDINTGNLCENYQPHHKGRRCFANMDECTLKAEKVYALSTLKNLKFKQFE